MTLKCRLPMKRAEKMNEDDNCVYLKGKSKDRTVTIMMVATVSVTVTNKNTSKSGQKDMENLP